jgi:hypothetical protein
MSDTRPKIGRPQLRPRVAIALDWLALTLAVAAVVMAWTGGFYAEIGGIRVSSRNPDRALLPAAIALAIRWWFASGVRPFGVERARWQRWRARLFQPAADRVDVPPGRWWLRVLLATFGILVFGGVLLQPQLERMDSVPDFGDPLFSMWRMGWVYQQWRGDPRPLFGGNIFYPEPLALTFSDSMLLPSLSAVPLRAAGVHPVIAYNVLFVSAFVFSALATFLLVERLTGSSRAAFVSALIYGFYPYRFEHYSHFELQMTHWMPLALIWLHRFSATLKVRDAIAVALLGAAQLYSSMYYGVFFALYAGAVLGTVLLVTRPARRRLLVPVAWAIAIAIALAVPLARPYLAARAVKGDRDENAIRVYSAGPSDYFRAHPRSATYGGRLLADRYAERALFPGTLPLVLSAAALVPPVGTIRLAYAAGLLTAFDVSLGFNGVTYKHLYRWFLPIRGLRVPARMSIVLAISLAVLAAFGARRLLRRFRTPATRSAVFAALVLAAAVDSWPVLDLHKVWGQPPPVYDAMAGRPVVLAEFPTRLNIPIVTNGVPFMYFSIWHWLPMINGYSGFTPPSYEPLMDGLRDFPAPAAIDLLRSRGVTHVTVNCALYVTGCEPVLSGIEASTAFRLVTAGHWEGQPVKLYELVR